MPLTLLAATSGSTTLQATDATTQTLTLPSGTGTLLTSSGAVTSAVAGIGISVSGSTGAVTITNTAPAVTAGEAKAWVKWVGSSGSISASYNVSSVTRNSTGHYTINFTNSLADGNYSVAGIVFNQTSGNGTRCLVSEGTPSASSFQVFNMLFNGSQEDANASIAVYR